MNILLLEAHTHATRALVAALIADGHQVVQHSQLDAALGHLQVEQVDVMIASLYLHDAEGRVGTSLAALMTAQVYNPDLVTVMLSDSTSFSHGELYALLPSLRCILGRASGAADLIEVARFLIDGLPENSRLSRCGTYDEEAPQERRPVPQAMCQSLSDIADVSPARPHLVWSADSTQRVGGQG
ncbi:hypothetical protein [Phaeovulum sp. W22_SRMD_FR3]|uniref:hypothetical protein n=1 Tax=Phaeovulum sp. W22_SRMD_FR3 TaxID=3240274 RepID=UPI003F97C2B3